MFLKTMPVNLIEKKGKKRNLMLLLISPKNVQNYPQAGCHGKQGDN